MVVVDGTWLVVWNGSVKWMACGVWHLEKVAISISLPSYQPKPT